MTVVISTSEVYAYGFVALIGFIILRRAWVITQGAPVRMVRLVVLPVGYLALYVGELAAIGYGVLGTSQAVPVYAGFGVDAGLLLLGVWVAYRYTRAHVHVYQDPGSSAWMYRMESLLPVLYVALYFIRTGIETVVLGLSPLVFPTAATFVGVSPLSLYLVFAVDALWGLSTGFLLGRSGAVYHEWQQKLAAPQPSSDAALP